ncbi:HEPN domain-containing protein [Paenibacillus sp. D51F]
MPEFERWGNRTGNSWVLRIFKQHHTLLNSMYWSYVPTSSYCNYLYRQNEKLKTASTTSQLLHLSGTDSHRVENKLEDWNKSIKEFDNWTRLNSLVALLSYFEVYLSSIVMLSLESDPGLHFKTSKIIDGMKIVKSNSRFTFDFKHVAEKITKGDWSQRIAAFREVFGTVPQIIVNNTKQLERMRKLRNNVAHAFGREIEKAQERGITQILDMDKLSLDSLKKYMQIISDIVYEIDNQLVNNHIGSYEVLFYYHNIQGQLPNTNRELALRKKLNSIGINGTCGEGYCKELIRYYDSL